VRESIRGYADAVIEQVGDRDQLATVATELSEVLALVDGSLDLRLVLTDPKVPAASRRGVITDLLAGRLEDATMRLLRYLVDADRATEWRDDLEWVSERLDAAARDLKPLGSQVLGRSAAEERIDGYATAVLEQLEDRSLVETIEDELFRFSRIVKGSDELRSVLSSGELSATARQGVVDDLLRSRATDASMRLAAYVTRVGRARDYEVLLDHLVDRVAAESNRRVADVRAPIELDDDQRRNLAAALNQVAGRAVEVRVTVDPAVLGGFVATIGDLVVDGSVRHRLDLLKERLGTPDVRTTIGDF
jgi:F-type H+-transporting ATPase subunit delta